LIFATPHGMPARTSDEKGVRPMRRTEERSVQIFIPYERSFSVVFWEEWWWGWPLLSIFTRSASAVTPSEKVLFTLMESSLHYTGL